MNITKRTAVSAAIIATLAAAGTVPVAFAQDPTGEATPEQSDTTHEERHDVTQGEFAAALAAELGIDVETVTGALEKVHAEMAKRREAEHRQALQERLDAAVEDGSLTQEQADALLAALESGVLGGFGGRGGPGGHRGPGLPGGLMSLGGDWEVPSPIAGDPTGAIDQLDLSRS